MDYLTVFMIAGGVSLVLGIVFILFYVNSKKLLDEMWAVDTYDAKELKRMCSGGFDATVEVEGKVSCDDPLESLAAKFPCCWFHTKVDVEERKTRTVVDRNSDGSHSTRVETYYEWSTTYDETFATIFKINDKSGYTLVDPVGADIDSESVCDMVVHERQPWFDGSIGFSDTGKYRIKEELFFPTNYAYVLGQASCNGDDALIHYPSEGYLDPKKKFFIISRKSEKALTKANQITVTLCFWFAIFMFLAAAFCGLVLLGVVPGVSL